jgi:hypothetical protein
VAPVSPGKKLALWLFAMVMSGLDETIVVGSVAWSSPGS